MHAETPKRAKILARFLLLSGWGLLSGFAPWRQVHPADSSLAHSLSRAPIWSHGYDGLPGARIDGFEFFLEAAIVFSCFTLVMTFVSGHRARRT